MMTFKHANKSKIFFICFLNTNFLIQIKTFKNITYIPFPKKSFYNNSIYTNVVA